MNTRTQQLIIPAVLCLFFATTALLAAGSKKNGGGSTTNPPPGTFTITGSMHVTRYGHKTVLLGNGQVLAVTGVHVTTNLDKSAELYNPPTGTWTLTGTPAMYHEGGSVTLLANGQVLLAGGDDPFNFYPPALTATAELYNPATGQWTMTGSMPSVRRDQTAVLLPNGEVLVAGGEDSSSASIATAILYNPTTGTWQSTESMHQSRTFAPAVLLTNGTVLVAGGIEFPSSGPGFSLTNAEIYNPSSAEWTAIADMPKPGGTAVLLQNADVLVARVAFFSPETGTWTPTGAAFPGNNTIGAGPSTATLLTTGDVLLTGFASIYNDTPSLNTSVLYNFFSNAYTAGAGMNYDRFADAAILLPNGQVLVSGGYNDKSVTA
jgi:hypothetical protein